MDIKINSSWSFINSQINLIFILSDRNYEFPSSQLRELYLRNFKLSFFRILSIYFLFAKEAPLILVGVGSPCKLYRPREYNLLPYSSGELLHWIRPLWAFSPGSSLQTAWNHSGGEFGGETNLILYVQGYPQSMRLRSYNWTELFSLFSLIHDFLQLHTCFLLCHLIYL